MVQISIALSLIGMMRIILITDPDHRSEFVE